ncbi:CHAT domain-containing protein [Streptomyces sp. 21So2-11]|uniref:CHAT domain-containing protein n=1 Tax=Streptomyces sp. 21So2-11 TaxID=3144408 RepID=UPI0032196F66
MVTSTLTILNDRQGEYEDDILYRREQNKHVRGPLGGSALLRETVNMLNRWVAEYEHCRRDELTLLGRCLYAIAFGEDSDDTADGAPLLRRAFEETYELHRTTLRSTTFRLRLIVRREALELGCYPWEFLFMPRAEGSGFFLAGEQAETVLSRYIPNSDTVPSDEDHSPLRILVVLSRPSSPGLAKVKADNLIKAVEELRSDETDVEVVDSPTRTELRDSIVRRPTHIIHFIGHGSGGAIALKKGERELRAAHADLYLRRSQGEMLKEIDEADWADSVSLCTLLRSGLDGAPGATGIRPRGRLIFLHACEGAGMHAVKDSLRSFSSIARDLADGERVAGVVAMQYAIGIEDAERFAVHFYSRLRAGDRLDEAVSQARWELGGMPGPGRQSWDHRCFGTPVIYVRQESAVFRYASVRRDAGYGGGGQLSAPVKAPCPNPLCLAAVITGQTRCRGCNSLFRSCPKGDCAGLVMTAPGSDCTTCDYRVPTHEERTAGHDTAQRSEPSDTRFDTTPRSVPRQQDGHADGKRLRSPHLHSGGDRDIGYGETPDDDAAPRREA